MEKILTIAFMITLTFCFAKLLEMKFIEKEWKPLKYIIRDAAIVFISSTMCLITFSYMSGSIRDFMNVVTDGKSANLASTEVFTDEPGF
jgi:hypothetical protein